MTGHQIRALYDEETITVYQAYSTEIATAAVYDQRLSASAAYKIGRMTWIKPSWCWMMYRCGYSYKDRGQERVLALKMKHAHFSLLLREAQLAHCGSSRVTGAKVIVQWDPERGPRLEKYDARSIQIGISGALTSLWIEKWICGIEDVTDKAKEMKQVLDEDPGATATTLQATNLMPVERVYEVAEDISQVLGIVQTEAVTE